ncbi:extracellular solute-binding protein [Paenibacillus sp. GYB003]|uniref:extracellular solute-binding protein n=1 Tax=Paenibacillus sp. GYB003 TaxID=2994392 RepID=UPI002F96E7B5
MSRRTRQSVLRAKLDDMIVGIREQIRSGKLNDGDFLPSETELAERYDISKHSVRKGLDLLVAQGYVEKAPRIGNKAKRPEPKPPVALRFGYYPSMRKQAALGELVQLYRQRHPEIGVELIPIPFKFDDLHLMQHYLESGLIDVAMFNQLSFAELHESGRLKELLEPLQPPDDLYPFLPPAFEAGGRLHALPFVFSPVVLGYNKDHFAEYDLPEPDSGWTWSDLLRVAAEIGREHKRVGFYYHALSDNRWPIFLLQSGEPFRAGDAGRIDFSAPAVREAIRTSRDILNEQGLTSLLSQSDGEAEELFRGGKATMIMTTYFGLNLLADAPFRFDIAPLPALRTNHTLNLVVGLAVSAKSPRKEEAGRLVRELTSMDYQSLIRRRTLSIPALKKAAERGLAPDHPAPAREPSRFMLYREIIRSFRLHSDLQLSNDALKRMRSELKLYWAGVTDLDACCRALEETLAAPNQPVQEELQGR